MGLFAQVVGLFAQVVGLFAQVAGLFAAVVVLLAQIVGSFAAVVALFAQVVVLLAQVVVLLAQVVVLLAQVVVLLAQVAGLFAQVVVLLAQVVVLLAQVAGLLAQVVGSFAAVAGLLAQVVDSFAPVVVLLAPVAGLFAPVVVLLAPVVVLLAPVVVLLAPVVGLLAPCGNRLHPNIAYAHRRLPSPERAILPPVPDPFASRAALITALCTAATLTACSSGGDTGGSTSGAGGATSSSGSMPASSTSSGNPGDAGNGDGGPIGGDRPVTVHVPPTYNPQTPAPLVVMLHGYTASGALEEAYLGITAESDKRGFLYAHPDGTKDNLGNRFWNATDACCNMNGSTVDDSAYISGIITDIQSRFSVDPQRVFLVGHSNGGFMSYRMACDHADQIAAIGSLAGAMWADTSKCKPSGPVSVLEIHGTADAVIAYNGGAILGNAYPAATTTVADWVALDGCDSSPDQTAPALDLDSSLIGDETMVVRYPKNCKQSTDVELWTIQGGSHLPTISPSFVPKLIDFLYAHPKP